MGANYERATLFTFIFSHKSDGAIGCWCFKLLALRKTKTPHSFGRSECKRVKDTFFSLYVKGGLHNHLQ